MNAISIHFIFEECSIEMSVKAGDRESVRLLPLGLMVNQSLDMVLFSITDYDLINATYPGKGICMTITLNLSNFCFVGKV